MLSKEQKEIRELNRLEGRMWLACDAYVSKLLTADVIERENIRAKPGIYPARLLRMALKKHMALFARGRNHAGK